MDEKKSGDASKISLLAACKKYVDQRIDNARQAIASASEAASDDTKSSAGDKFETTREMMQQELTRHQQLLAEAKRMDQVLANLDTRVDGGPARLGSLVVTNHGIFFIAISIGQLQADGMSYWVISPASPLGQLLIGVKTGEQIVFNGTIYQITNIA
ncbi:MAG TPA: hypothetical protein VNQ80_19070 [Parapedobacter sp.]|uniref:3-oxoacyl-ACP synthase n=1 Tax=Parapedobacter sp. TaxID=1958893 RepID=UPI002B60D0CA|nr:3-oxoacyl-ACP synthase [Parapedobacter sp.]HWK59453.1 hypothetical protein [Parapedobacter sp.]